MSLARFRQYAEQTNWRAPDPKWSVLWMRRLFEYWKQPVDVDLPMNADRLVEFLKAIRSHGAPTWQRHQAAVTVGRYQAMLQGEIEVGIQDVIRRLADAAAAERLGDQSMAQRETRFPQHEPPILTEMRKTLRRRRYKFDTEKAYLGWAQRFLDANPGRAIEELAEPEIRAFLSALVSNEAGGVAASTLKQAKSALTTMSLVHG